MAILMPTRTTLQPIERALEAAGIPYRVESRSLVYETQEVRDLLSILCAVDDATDQVALIAALRAPAFGCTDDELLEYRQENGAWDFRVPIPESLPPSHPVSAAMTALKALHEARWWRSISETVEAVIRERHMFELAFAFRRPRERWQRLRFVLDQARAFEEAGGRTLRQFVEWAERQTEEGTRIVETAVPEADDDAVRIMTVHAAKGLEFPVVLMCGLNLQQASERKEAVLWHEDGQLEVCIGDFKTKRYDECSQREREMERHEKIRLLYVAATRAKDHLVLSLHHKDGEKEGEASHAAMLYGLVMARRDLWTAARLPATQGSLPLPAASSFDDSAERRTTWLAKRAAEIEANRRRPARSATEIARADARDPGMEKEPPIEEVPPWKRGRAGTALGRAVHAVLQSIDLATGADIDAAASAQAAAEGIADREGEVARMVRSALAAPSVRAAVASGRYWRELYASGAVDGVTIEGFIDLLYESPEGLVVVDYKTDVMAEGAGADQGAERYRLQGAAYVLALEQALGRPVVKCVFVFAQPREALERHINDLPRALDEVRDALRPVSMAG
jgi:ATP-dependent exoDNAse (exonuclease V) beta subunit